MLAPLKLRDNVLYSTAGGIFTSLLFLCILLDLPLLPFLHSFSCLPLLLIGLSLGEKPLIVSSLIALAIVTLVNYHYCFQLIFHYLLPSIFLVRQALLNRPLHKKSVEWYPTGLLLASLAAYGLLYVVAQIGLKGDDLIINQSTAILQNQPADITPEKTAQLKMVLSLMKTFFSGITGVSIIIWMIINSMIAQKILIHYKLNMRPNPSFVDCHMPWWPWVALAVTGVGAFVLSSNILGYIALNMSIVLCFAFFLEGLSIIHGIARKLTNSNFMLWIFYFLMVVFGGIMVMLIVIMTIFEPWLQLRQRFSNNKG